ncbi:hypothetical protein K1W54_03330 [Micromonospora sp. CPCC 205371]|nr:hypothetical protein [Micromonospora sp. CPCC 205371]
MPAPFDALTTAWDTMPFDEALALLPPGTSADGAAGVDVFEFEFDVLFGDDPERVFVHRGNITVSGATAIGNGHHEGYGEDGLVYLIDGDLAVDGPLHFYNEGYYAALLVTGSVTAESLFCSSECWLFVAGSLTVSNLLVTDLYECGSLRVQGATTTRAWLDTDRDVDVRLSGDRDHGGHVAADPAAVLLPEFLDERSGIATDALFAAAFANRSMTRESSLP